MPESVVEKTPSDCPPFAAAAVALVVVVAGIVSVLSATRYGYYYDELYFIAAGKRPSFSYADQGPLVPLLAAVWTGCFRIICCAAYSGNHCRSCGRDGQCAHRT